MYGNPDQKFDEVVLGRRSIRGYLDKAVPKELIERARLTAVVPVPSPPMFPKNRKCRCRKMTSS